MSNLSTLFLSLLTGALGGILSYFASRLLIKAERRADFHKKLDEEQVASLRKLYAAAKHVSIRKESPYALAYKQNRTVMLRRKNAERFVQDISEFLVSEDGAFIDPDLSKPLWGLRNLIFAVLEEEKSNISEEIELVAKGNDVVGYVETFRNTYRAKYQLRTRKMKNIALV